MHKQTKPKTRDGQCVHEVCSGSEKKKEKRKIMLLIFNITPINVLLYNII